MCRNIKTLFNFEPPATVQEVYASSIQYVRKISGFQKPSKINQEAMDRAVTKVAQATRELLETIVTNAIPRNREDEAAKARAKALKRFGKVGT